jgi:hypothetical protein
MLITSAHCCGKSSSPQGCSSSCTHHPIDVAIKAHTVNSASSQYDDRKGKGIYYTRSWNNFTMCPLQARSFDKPARWFSHMRLLPSSPTSNTSSLPCRPTSADIIPSIRLAIEVCLTLSKPTVFGLHISYRLSSHPIRDQGAFSLIV